jgi:16S rRNA processing protein RimM
MSPRPNRILLGHIGEAHGIRGELVVKSHAAVPEDIATYGPLQDEAGERSFELEALRTTAKGVVCRIRGIADRTAAEALRGTKLYVARERLPVPAEGEFYHSDLIGLAAVHADGSPIGEIVAVRNFGAGDLIEIRLAGGTRTELVPFDARTVPTIDLEAGQAVISPSPGLLDK